MTKLVTRDTLQGSLTANASTELSTDQLTHAELDKNFFPIAIATDGTAEAEKALVLDASKDFTGVADGTFTGTVTANVFTGPTVAATNIAATNLTSGGTNVGFWETMDNHVTTSGLEYETTGIDSSVTQVKVSLTGVSLTGSSTFHLQAGDSSGYSTTASTGIIYIAATPTIISATTGFIRINYPTGSAESWNGTLELTLSDPTNYIWAVTGNVYSSNSDSFSIVGGRITLAGALDRIKLITSVDNFDAGAATVYAYHT